MENLRKYVSTVTKQVTGLIEKGSAPNPEQLNGFIKQVVSKLQELTQRAPRDVQDKCAAPFAGLWDFKKKRSSR